MSLKRKIRGFYISCQLELFPRVERNYGMLSGTLKKLLLVFESVNVEDHLPRQWNSRVGRPLAHRATLARAFLAKMVLNIPTTSGLRERLLMDDKLRSLCGWASSYDVPSEPTFSRAFKEFAEAELPNRIHEALIREGYEGELVGHISRDSTAIEAREKPVSRNEEVSSKPKKRKRGRPKKGEEVPTKAPRRLETQPTMELEEMLDELPKDCTVGCKRNAKGYTQQWTGYKLHMDTADGGVPISCVITSASLHDSQAAIPLAKSTKQRVENCYDLMDGAYDAKEIDAYVRELGRVPIIDRNPRSKKAEARRELKAQRHARFTPPERIRYRERSTVERAFGRLKDEYGARHLRVRGHKKVMCHLMFGVVALTVDQMIRLVQ